MSRRMILRSDDLDENATMFAATGAPEVLDAPQMLQRMATVLKELGPVEPRLIRLDLNPDDFERWEVALRRVERAGVVVRALPEIPSMRGVAEYEGGVIKVIEFKERAS